MQLISKYLIILILGGNLAAQTGIVAGQVIDRSTGLPLVGANIMVQDFNLGSATDLTGRYSMMLKEGTFQITCSVIGYAPATLGVNIATTSSSTLNFELEPVTIESKHFIHIQGEKTSGHMLGHLQQTNLSTTENLISMIEGVSLIARGSYAQEPTIRGMSGGRMNITINGMKSFGACTDRMDPITSYVEADALNSIEIGKGALSIQNGSTVGGSLNLTMKQPQYAPKNLSQWHIKGGFDAGSKERKFSFSWNKKTPGSGISLSGAYRKAKDYADASGHIISYTGFEKMNLNLGYKKRLNQESQLLLEFVSDDAYNVGYSALPMDVGYARLRMAGLSLKTRGISPHILNAEWKVYGNAIDHWMDDSKREVLFMDMHMDMPGFTRTAGSYVDLLLGRDQRSMLKLRSDYYWTSSYADMVMYPEGSSPMEMVTWPGVERWNMGQFMEYQSIIIPDMNVNLSMRYDLFHSRATNEMGQDELHIFYPGNNLERMDHLLSANAHVAYNIVDNWRSILSVASGQRIPTVSEAYGYYLYNPVDGYLYLGNPDLPVETSRQIEWQNNLTSSAGSMSLNLYFYKFEHYIFGQTMSEDAFSYANGWKKYIDGGSAQISGLEWSVLHRFSPHFIFQGGVNYEASSLDDFQDFLPLIPPLEVHGSLTYERRRFWVQMDTRGAAAQTNNSKVSGENSTPAFLAINLKGELDILPGLKLNLGINNLTNQLYHEHLDWGDIYRPGRSGFISLTLNNGIMGQ
ncbi:MAG: TonB-dependent receptor [Candidatus Marinimicrobia bacterium]|jgi:iron complex outermembrane recepter protein|nr:TonB-dependent receptor [Candidatus Neomarinimicrobiota bacterium]MBT4360683.1 TonB-dependent receptor [Candidatus Neomarinimicrobiota bacterium]MBT4715042.1 TonB-dependent receptor [Candidatus Neomarinimicrobiota bacterium]MBT4944581.1 TonB-dependent receptor [Candidatus Neomarinimicrobiota bacterium]MBT5271385.1 TonB-dependent receptor [Candidatus Neomarinimicrobiota bacterium]